MGLDVSARGSSADDCVWRWDSLPGEGEGDVLVNCRSTLGESVCVSLAQITVYVNKVGPYFNPQETYHYYSLPVCRPEKVSCPLSQPPLTTPPGASCQSDSGRGAGRRQEGCLWLQHWLPRIL